MKAPLLILPPLLDNTKAYIVNGQGLLPYRGNSGGLDICTDLGVGDSVRLSLSHRSSCNRGNQRCNGICLSLLDCQSLK